MSRRAWRSCGRITALESKVYLRLCLAHQNPPSALLTFPRTPSLALVECRLEVIQEACQLVGSCQVRRKSVRCHRSHCNLRMAANLWHSSWHVTRWLNILDSASKSLRLCSATKNILWPTHACRLRGCCPLPRRAKTAAKKHHSQHVQCNM